MFDQKMTSISIYSLVGEKVFEKSVNSSQEELHMPVEESGIYLMEVRTEQGEKYHQKLIINK